MIIKETKNILYRLEKNWPKKGVNFVDLTPTLNDGDKFYEIAEQLKERIVESVGEVDYIVSPDARGFIWGSYIACLLHKPLIPIRKSGKLPPNFVMSTISDTTEYSTIELDLPKTSLKGKRCVFVDDVYATGGTYRACQKLIMENGGQLLGAFVILDILISNDEVHYLINSDDLDIK